jgi:hypothetical protein
VLEAEDDVRALLKERLERLAAVLEDAVRRGLVLPDPWRRNLGRVF